MPELSKRMLKHVMLIGSDNDYVSRLWVARVVILIRLSTEENSSVTENVILRYITSIYTLDDIGN